MRMGWRGLLGIGLSIVLLWVTLRDVDLAEIWTILSGSHLGLWIACTVAATSIFPLRARRWQAILAPSSGRLPVTPLWHATAIGMMVNNVLPVRAGEFARAFALSRARTDIGFTAAFASLVVDRVFDGVVVLALLLLATLDPRFPANATINGWSAGQIAAVAATALGAVLVCLVALVAAPEAIMRVAERVVSIVWPAGGPKVRALLESFASGIGVLRSPALLLEVLAWTVLHWIANGIAFWFGFLALGIDAPFSATFFLQGLIAIGVAFPSSPGFFGIFELAGKAGLGLYGVPAAQAVSWALGFHVLSFIPITVLGTWYLSRLHLHLSDVSAQAAAGRADREAAR